MKKIKPDIVMLDVFMPVMDGKEFLKNFDPKKYPETEIFVCTNLSDSKIESGMLALGAKKVVVKSSMAPKDLIEMITYS